MTTESLTVASIPQGLPAETTRSAGIDACKFVAFIGVVFIHTSHALDISGPSALGFLDQISRFAVPFFFLASGYFLGLRSRPGWPAWRRRSIRILTIFAFWSFFYVLLARPSLHELVSVRFLAKWILSGGPGYHLWFLPSLLICLSVFLVALSVSGTNRVLMVPVALYLFGMAFGSYRLALGLPDLHFNTHNGPFFGTLFVAAGYLLAKKKLLIPFPAALAMAIFGAAAHIGESLLLDRFHFLPFSANEFSFGTVPFSIGIFALALGAGQSRLGAGNAFSFARLGQLSLGLYCIHVAYIWLFSKAFDQFGVMEVLALSCLVIAASVSTVLLLSKLTIMQRLLN